MKNSTEKQLNHESYYVNYPYEQMVARYDAKNECFYYKLYGGTERELDKDSESQASLVMNAVRFGDEIDQETYNNK